MTQNKRLHGIAFAIVGIIAIIALFVRRVLMR
jgi:hypothetical protein